MAGMIGWVLIGLCGFAAIQGSCLGVESPAGETATGSWVACAPEGLPQVTVRWEDWEQRDVFVVEGARYRCRVATQPARILSLQIDGKDLLGPTGIRLGFTDRDGVRYAPAPRDFKPRWDVWRRQWVPAQDSRARMNVWSAGPYYWDAHLLDIPFVRAQAPDPNTPPAARGELVFHAYPDQLRIEYRLEPLPGQPLPAQANLDGDGTLAPAGVRQKRPLAEWRTNGVSAAVLGPSGAAFEPGGAWNAPLDGAAPDAYWVVRPLAPGETPAAAFADDLDPLPAAAFSVTGGHWLGYNPPSGLYQMRADANLPAFGFEAVYMNPARRLVTRVRLKNDRHPRHFIVECLTGIGNLEAAVLADGFGFPLPVPVQVCKNFKGELEEPDDTAFGDSYFPLRLGADEHRSFQLFHLIQDWGSHPLKQVSSIRFFHVYWHLSTGASETTCFTQDWMEIGRSGILHIPDFRPLSGPFWPRQPQHSCLQWPGFLQYNDRAARLVYEKTVFESISPNLARFTMHFHTSDGAATAKVGVMEIPQRDEMRTFLHLRYDWQKPVAIEGDARVSFRWLNLFEKHTPAALLWTDATGATRTVPIQPTEKPLLLGEPLAAQSPFVASHARDVKAPDTAHASDAAADNYSCLILVRDFRARLGGKEYAAPAVSAQFNATDGSYWLTVPTRTLALQPGDFVDADVMLMPNSERTLPALKPEREREERFGAGIPTAEVAVGTKLLDFPAVVRARDEVAQVTLAGGFDAMPLIVEGFRGWGVPLLWRDGVWQDQQAHGGDGYQVDADGSGGYRFTFLYPIRDGQSIPLLVTRASCTTGISRMRDENGRLALEAPAPGQFTLKAPVLFGPGRNDVDAGSPVIAFQGTATSVHQVPVAVSVPKGKTAVEVDGSGRAITLTGSPAEVTFQELAPGAAYGVTINGQQSRQIATNGMIHVRAAGPTTRIAVVAAEASSTTGHRS